MADSSSQTTSSGASVVTAVIMNLAIFIVFIIAFLILKNKHRHVYEPRLAAAGLSDSQRPRPLKRGWISWLPDLLSRSDAETLRDAGLDGYFFLRYLRLTILVCLVGIIMLYPILLSVNATGGGSPQRVPVSGFDILSFSNVKNKNRYFAHVFLSWLFFGFILFSLYRELQYYVSVRQSVLTSPAYCNNVSQRTVLISAIPTDYCSDEAIRNMFTGVKHVTLNRNHKKLEDLVEKRDKLVAKIEAGANKYLKLAAKNRLKAEKKGKNVGDDISDVAPLKKRPTYRTKPLIGQKMDTLTDGAREVANMNKEIAKKQAESYKDPLQNSAFVTFFNQEQAQNCYQTLSHHRPLHMYPKAIGTLPDEIVWSNMRLVWWQRLIKELIAACAIIAVVIFWSIPVAFVGFISNLDNLIKTLHFLKFLNNLPKVLHGLITSMLPTILLAVLMMLLPMFIRKMAKVSGKTSVTQVEYYTQNSFFAFQVVQVFLVTTLASGAGSVITNVIDKPSSAMNLLATRLPSASNFYISYFLLQGFTVSAGMFLAIVGLILFYVLGMLLDSTPRKKWSRYNIVGGTAWGTIFPVYSNLFIIVITYSIISPILLVFGALTFGLIYLAFLNNLSFRIKPTNGGGLYYCRAIYQTFVGLYIGEVCLMGLFVLAKTWGPLALEVVMLLVTIFVQIHLQSAFEPLQYRLPTSLMNPTDTDSTNQATQETSKSINEAESGTKLNIPSGGQIARYFMPHKFLSPHILRQELLTSSQFMEPPPPLTEEEERDAYKHPAETADNPLVWVPKDPWGYSTEEVAKLRDHDINITDDGAYLSVNQEKKKIAGYRWAEPEGIPIYKPEPVY